MASIIEGYEYDIFISYRQKDNKYDSWVSEFVDNLKKELEATFKEEISVYFDINPHDGLLETHDVDASLKEKLKCLLFIPIISRTYCDPKSFAWEHEFKSFIEQASYDQFGLKIKLPGGNVANRVLPVQIHELDADDRKLVESELGGFLRGIEFIYKEPGVNRPLLSNEDHPDNNLNKTFYRNQINKVANAIKEIITGLKNPDREGEKISLVIKEEKSSLRKNFRTKIIIGALILLVLIVAGYFIFPKLIKPKELLEKSIAVLPFRNDSPSDSTTYFIDGVMEEILTNLQTIKDIRVISRTSVEQYRKQTKSIPEIAKELGVNYIVEGSGQKSSNTFRLRIQLIRAAKESHLWAKSYEQKNPEAKDYFNTQSQIAQAIALELKAVITPQEIKIIERIPTTDMAAWDAYLKGQFYTDKLTEKDMETAMQYFELAKERDPEFALAYAGISRVWACRQQMHIVQMEEAAPKNESALMKALELDSTQADIYHALAGFKVWTRWDWKGGEASFLKAIELNPNYAIAHSAYSHLLNILGRPDEAMKQIEIALKLDPLNPQIKAFYGMDLMFVHRYDEAVNAFQEALELSPNHLVAYSNMDNALYFAGRDDEAISWLRSTSKDPEFLKELDKGYSEAGFRGAMKKLADLNAERSRSTYIIPISIGVFYALAGDIDNAMIWLEKAYNEHDPNLPYLLEPKYDKLRDDPRFQDLCQRMNLPYK